MAEKWKFLVERNGRIESMNGQQAWTPGEWVDHQDALSLCESGFHASERIQQAFSYIQGDLLARVETRGEVVDEGDKSVHASMRLTKVYRWTSRDSVELAIFAAEQVLSIFESNRPGDDRPRKAIEAAQAYLAAETEDAEAAWAAGAAAGAAAGDAAGDAARDAAWAAAEAARAAAWAAGAAAWASGAAAGAARTAAWAAGDAAGAARTAGDAGDARQALLDKIEGWMVTRVEVLAEWTAPEQESVH